MEQWLCVCMCVCITAWVPHLTAQAVKSSVEEKSRVNKGQLTSRCITNPVGVSVEAMTQPAELLLLLLLSCGSSQSSLFLLPVSLRLLAQLPSVLREITANEANSALPLSKLIAETG